jgi:hypothetical protein
MREKADSPPPKTICCYNSTCNIIANTLWSVHCFLDSQELFFVFLFPGSVLHQHKLQSGWMHKIFRKLSCFKKKSLKVVLFSKSCAVYDISRMWKWLFVLENWPLTKQKRKKKKLDNSKCKAINWLISDPWLRMSSSTQWLAAPHPVGTAGFRRAFFTNNHQFRQRRPKESQFNLSHHYRPHCFANQPHKVEHVHESSYRFLNAGDFRLSNPGD